MGIISQLVSYGQITEMRYKTRATVEHGYLPMMSTYKKKEDSAIQQYFASDQESIEEKTDRVSYGFFLGNIDIYNNTENKLRILCVMPLLEEADLRNPRVKECYHYPVNAFKEDLSNTDIVRLVKDDQGKITTIFVNKTGKTTSPALHLGADAIAECVYEKCFHSESEECSRGTLCTFEQGRDFKVNPTYKKLHNFSLVESNAKLRYYTPEMLKKDYEVIYPLVNDPPVPLTTRAKNFGRSFVNSFKSKEQKKQT